MKILTSAQIRAWDQETILREPVSSLDLMERAAAAFTARFLALYGDKVRVKVFCGPGNNGGDGLAIARMFRQKGCLADAFVLNLSKNFSPDFLANHKRLLNQAPDQVFYLNQASQLLPFQPGDVVIDAIFGTGLSRPAEGLSAEIIRKINNSHARVISVDVPSGLFTDSPNGPHDAVIRAERTLTFQIPKLSFLLCQNYPFTGEWERLDIGLLPSFPDEMPSAWFATDEDDASRWLQPRGRCDHKGTFGHTLVWAGSYGKTGAALLCARAALRTGAGLVTAYLPRSGYTVFQTALPEAMVLTDTDEEKLTTHPELEKYRTIAIGPGIGTHAKTASALEKLLREARQSVVLDADGLNILAGNRELLRYLPRNSVLTPHPKEFERMAGESPNDWARLEKARSYAREHNIILVLKSAYTATCLPDGSVYFNTTGTPALAKGGTGDVLTGIIAGLISQGYSPSVAAPLGVYIHGKAGQLAASTRGMRGVLAHEVADMVGLVIE